MKTINIFLVATLLTILTAGISYAQTAPKVIAVINTAQWCKVCKVNKERTMGIIPAFKDKPVVFFPNDLTNQETKAQSKKGLEQLKVTNAVAQIAETRVIVLIDAKTHTIINQISVAESNETIQKAINDALAKI